MSLFIHKVSTSRDMAEFTPIPYDLHRHHAEWIPPFRMMERSYINPKKNGHASNADTVCYIASRDGKPEGRIMGIINHELEEVERNKQARFCCFETANNEETAFGLLSAVEDWAEEHGLTKLVGPLGFSNQDPQGFIVEGFDERPSVSTIHNFEYVPSLLEKAGFEKEIDFVTYKIPIPDKAPDLYYTLAPRVTKRP